VKLEDDFKSKRCCLINQYNDVSRSASRSENQNASACRAEYMTIAIDFTIDLEQAL